MPTFSKLITKMIVEGTENGKYIEPSGDSTNGWYPTDDPKHWVFEAYNEKDDMIMIHWYGVSDPRNNMTLAGTNKNWELNGIFQITRTDDGYLTFHLGEVGVVELY